jgi:hypothetical protein
VQRSGPALALGRDHLAQHRGQRVVALLLAVGGRGRKLVAFSGADALLRLGLSFGVAVDRRVGVRALSLGGLRLDADLDGAHHPVAEDEASGGQFGLPPAGGGHRCHQDVGAELEPVTLDPEIQLGGAGDQILDGGGEAGLVVEARDAQQIVDRVGRAKRVAAADRVEPAFELLEVGVAEDGVFFGEARLGRGQTVGGVREELNRSVGKVFADAVFAEVLFGQGAQVLEGLVLVFADDFFAEEVDRRGEDLLADLDRVLLGIGLRLLTDAALWATAIDFIRAGHRRPSPDPFLRWIGRNYPTRSYV